MSRTKLFTAIGIAILASVIATVLLLISSEAPYSSPEKSIAAFIGAESRADLSAIEESASPALYRNFVGHFGEAKYREIRSIYQTAYDLAEPKWEQYREKAHDAALKEHQSIADQIGKLGHDAFTALPEDKRLALTDDRARFNDFVFEEGLKALPADVRGKIIDPQAFQENRDIDGFTNREGFGLLPKDDQKALKTPSALSSAVTPERIAFLESIGVPLLTAQQRQAIVGISSSDLSDPQAFMFRYGHDPAQHFLKNSALAPDVAMGKCSYISEDNSGNLFKGSTAVCGFSVNVRGVRIEAGALLQKQRGAWKIAVLSPMLTEIQAAYPPKPARHEAVTQPAVHTSAPVEEAGATTAAYVQKPWIPNASWQEISDSTSAAAERTLFFDWLSKLFPEVMSHPTTTLFALIAIVVFCVVMTINYRRLRHERFLPEWLEGEVQLEEIQVSHWWSRVWLRLTNKRIIQVRLSWLLSRRKIFGIALDDIHSVTWRRYMNWLLILVGILLFSRSNPVALLVLMWGLESRILSIGFNAPLAQLPLPRARAAITSFRRQQFNDLATFYKKAQLHLAQVRTQKQLPVQRDIKFMPEEDKDFSWGRLVWFFVVLWLIVALGQRTLDTHVTLEGVWGGILFGLPVAAAVQSLRSGVWSGALGAAAFVAVKFPGSVGLLLLARDHDGGSPNLWQYFVLVVSAAAIGAAAYGLSHVHVLAAFLAPFLWLLPIAIMQTTLLGEMRTYATCFIAIASAAAFSIVADAVSNKAVPTVSEPEYAQV